MVDLPRSESDGEFRECRPSFDLIAQRYHLLLPERLLARRFFEHWYSTPELAGSSTTLNNGPVALALMGVMYAWGIPGVVGVLLGIGSLVVSGGAAYAYWVLCIGSAMIAIGILRGLPGLSAIKKYQAERTVQRQLPPPPPDAGPPGPQ